MKTLQEILENHPALAASQPQLQAVRRIEVLYKMAKALRPPWWMVRGSSGGESVAIDRKVEGVDVDGEFVPVFEPGEGDKLAQSLDAVINDAIDNWLSAQLDKIEVG